MGLTENVRRLGLISSMGTVGDCYDNTPMESFLGLDASGAAEPPALEDQSRAGGRDRRLHRALLQPRPTAQLARLPHAERIRRPTFTPTPGHVVIRGGPPNGVKATEHPQRHPNPWRH